MVAGSAFRVGFGGQVAVIGVGVAVISEGEHAVLVVVGGGDDFRVSLDSRAVAVGVVGVFFDEDVVFQYLVEASGGVVDIGIGDGACVRDFGFGFDAAGFIPGVLGSV